MWVILYIAVQKPNPKGANPQNSRENSNKYPRQLPNHAITLQQIFMVHYSWTTHSFRENIITPLSPAD